MNIATIIVLGIIAVSIIGVIGDVVTKLVHAKVKADGGSSGAGGKELETLQRRIDALESKVEEREDSIKKLQEELRFVSRMLEDRTNGS